jgi:hypothetical protein
MPRRIAKWSFAASCMLLAIPAWAGQIWTVQAMSTGPGQVTCDAFAAWRRRSLSVGSSIHAWVHNRNEEISHQTHCAIADFEAPIPCLGDVADDGEAEARAAA